MNFERKELSQYLVNNLRPLTAADPKILADYVLALLKNDVPAGELQKLCADRLEVFLGHSSMSFTTKLFEALEEGSFQSTDVNLDVMKISEPSMSNAAVESLDLKSLLSKEDNLSSSSEPVSDPEDKENSDDDADRNHKHRKRDARENSFDNAVQEQPIRRLGRKRGRNQESGQFYLETGVQPHEIHKEYGSSTDRDVLNRLDKRNFGISPSARFSSDLNSRSRLNTPFRTDPGLRLDLSTSVGRASLGRGRGRNLAAWSQPDSRFNSLDPLDFTSHMASQRPVHPGLFVGPGLQGAVSSQNASWGAFGFIHGISNGIMDPLHPLGLQTTLRPTINPMNLGIPRQRCRDFEERGFCLRGDMCPMEHGVNRIVVEDVQSLSQFNLPVSITNSHVVGAQVGTGPLHPVPASQALMVNKNMPSKNSKSTTNEDTLNLHGPNSVVGGEADVYDPDQPLWNNNTDASAALLRLPSLNTEDETLWEGDASHKISRLSDDNECDLHSRNLTANIGPQGAGFSVWGRIGSGSKSEIGIKFENNNSAPGHIAKDSREGKDSTVCSSVPSDQSKLVSSGEFGPKMVITQPVSAPRSDFERKGGRMQQKACRTLFVCGIPQKNNRREALLSHFQKFGEVIDIYIPLNSEKAFVQFSKREVAESALKSPDAVMGNRFIKLFWANRDRISEEGQGSGKGKPLQYSKEPANSARMQPPAVELRKETPSLATHKESNAKTVEASVSFVGPQKGVILNGPKALTSPKKKVDNLELLEELRKKQVLLAQKRDEFRRQLVKFERQTSIKKTDGSLEQTVKKQKTGLGNGSAKAVDSVSTAISISSECQDAGKSVERSSLAEVQVSPSTKACSIVKQTSRMPVSHPNRFKLDNRPTSFRVLPPLPAKLGNIPVLKDHFSKFGDLASVVFEAPEENENSVLKEPEKKYVCVTFHTRHSAERAYQAGKYCEGCTLKFAWVTASSVAGKDR
ncbi:zinc finger CCCH domain-containing protein 27, partial [Phalaenopsis equestris]|uniref:zinc finger CCCH domain-containing protein 27 n=1 Tax=Phalaenopsis equestris TaxID=78828 RepID=UPI0009E3CC2E